MLIKPGLLNRIERRVGPKPDEGLFEVLRDTGPVAEGAGFKRAGRTVVDTVAGRATHISDLNIAEKQKQSAIRADADYFVSLKAGTDVRNEDKLREIALDWEADKYYFAGQKTIPTTANGKLYLCQVGGRSDAVEPTWPESEGDTVVDGDATWRCLGNCPVMEVVEVGSPNTFGDYISKKVFAKLRQL